jgi:zinc transport system ATP-binding protein
MMKKLLSLENIHAGYNGKTVLSEINFEVFQNDFIGIIGPNGGGKTSLLKIILGMLKPSSGSISYYFDDEDNTFRSHIGYLPQVNSFDKKFPISVKEVILSGLLTKKSIFQRYNKEDSAKASSIMEQFGLTSLCNTIAGELSGGQLQRVFLARALIAAPKLLILDEPDTYVDNRFEYELYSLLKEINKNTAILLVSHDIGIISSYIKTIACVNFVLHYHPSNEISSEQLKVFNCPIDIITHGTVPHRVLHDHK